jgi:beta-glucosidase
MTLEDKIAQLQQLNGFYGNQPAHQSQRPGSVLSILNEEAGAAIRFSLQSPLKIPTLVGIDAIHGHGFYAGATVFPVQLGIASSWDEDLIEMQGNITAFEMRYTGPSWTFSPVLCIARDLRWGRVDETFGEDPYLIAKFGAALVRGLQGPGGISSDPDKVMATAKHYAGYSETEGGRDASEAELSHRKLYSWFLPPFRKLSDERIGSVMTAYQSIDGIPAVANKWLLTEVLRNQWNFKGFVVTDYNCV